MLLEHDKYDISITSVKKATDYLGVEYLHCKGSRCYKKLSKKGTRINAYDTFSSVRLYGDPELLDMTMDRLWAQTEKTPRLKLHVIVGDIECNYSKPTHMIFVNLYVREYDFVTNKYGTKRKNRATKKAIEQFEKAKGPDEFIIE